MDLDLKHLHSSAPSNLLEMGLIVKYMKAYSILQEFKHKTKVYIQ